MLGSKLHLPPLYVLFEISWFILGGLAAPSKDMLLSKSVPLIFLNVQMFCDGLLSCPGCTAALWCVMPRTGSSSSYAPEHVDVGWVTQFSVHFISSVHIKNVTLHSEVNTGICSYK